MTNAFLDSLVDTRLDDALTAAADGRPLIIRARRPDTPQRLYDRATNGRAMLDRIEVAVASDRTPQDSLLDAARDVSPDIVDLGEFSRSSYLTYKLFTVDLRNCEAEAWLTLAGTFAARRIHEDDGAALALITDGANVPNGCDYLDDGDFFGPAEAAVFVRERRTSHDLLTACGDAAAIEVARGDLDQLDSMLNLPLEDRFDLAAWVRKQPVTDTKLIWRGAEEICSTWLAANNPKRLRHRIWRGQVTVLFPWLAEALGLFLEKHARHLPRDLRDQWSGDYIRPEEFEWSQILFVLNKLKAKEADCAFRLRRMRNALAHQDPLTWDEARNAETDLKTLLALR